MIKRAHDIIPFEAWRAITPGNLETPASCQFMAFNTVVSLQAFGEESATEQVFEQAIQDCRTYERLFSRTLPHSDISHIAQGVGGAVEIDPLTYELLQASLFYCERSGGLFDVTMGAVTRLWDFHTGVVPAADQLEQALTFVDWHRIELGKDPAGSCFARIPTGFHLDLGGIAKGFIADKLTALFLDCGLENFVINLGGNVVAHGCKPTGKPWVVGIRDPQADHEGSSSLLQLEALNTSVVTSGTTERCFEQEGERYHHILSSSSGLPVSTNAVSVSVCAPSSLDAEGFSTTLLALGIERGMEFAAAEPRITTAIFVDENNGIHQI